MICDDCKCFVRCEIPSIIIMQYAEIAAIWEVLEPHPHHLSFSTVTKYLLALSCVCKHLYGLYLWCTYASNAPFDFILFSGGGPTTWNSATINL